MDVIEFFTSPQNAHQKQYETLRAFYLEGQPATTVAQHFGYTLSSFYALTRDFRKCLQQDYPGSQYFITESAGAKLRFEGTQTEKLILELRKKSLSTPDIKSILDALGHSISQRSISTILEQAGFSRLPRRSKKEREENLCAVQISAPISEMLTYESETFTSTKGIGILCLLPYLQVYGITQVIENSEYPETERLNRRCSLLSFVTLKLSNIRHYSSDNSWCMDRGLGFFAGLNVLPKAT